MSAAYEANTLPAGLGRTLRPTRSVSSTPSSRASADTAADTDGWDTTSSSAAAVTEPVRTTARKLRSWVIVTAIWLSVLVDRSADVYVYRHGILPTWPIRGRRSGKPWSGRETSTGRP